jgi:biotin carboxyl carrier protein
MKYIVTLNGKKYEVEVERADAPKAAPAAAAPAAAPAPAVVSAGEFAVKAPMPGTISEIKVAAGQQVKRGDVLILLEAMKMENEILADHDAVVAGIAVSKGASVNTGDLLITLK